MFVLRSNEAEATPAPQNDDPPDPVNRGEAPGHGGGGDVAPSPGARRARPQGEPEGKPVRLAVVEPAEPDSRPLDLPLFAAAFAVRFGGPRAALECPKHLSDVQGVIDRVSARMKAVRARMPQEQAELVDALLDDARMLQEAARQNHERPRGAYDHARAFAKADAALGHARAAEILQSRSAQG